MSERLKLFLENGSPVGLYDVCQYWVETYPSDIFISAPEEIVKIREIMLEILAKRKQ